MKKIILFVVCLFMLPGCGTVMTGFSQDIKLDSSVKCWVYVYDNSNDELIKKVISPGVVNLFKKSILGAVYRLEFRRRGYSPEIIYVKTEGNWWYYLGNILVGGPVGWFIIDPLTGGMWSIKPDFVYANMHEMSEIKKDSIYVLMRDQVPDEVMKKAMKIN